MTAGRILIHKHGADWHTRHPDHPTDPGWESGTYSRCHARIRRAMEPGEWLLDAVSVDGLLGVRSLFQIRAKVGEVLLFTQYWFAEGDLPVGVSASELRRIRPDALVRRLHDESRQLLGPLRSGMRLGGTEFESLLHRLQRSMTRRLTRRIRSAASTGSCPGCERRKVRDD